MATGRLRQTAGILRSKVREKLWFYDSLDSKQLTLCCGKKKVTRDKVTIRFLIRMNSLSNSLGVRRKLLVVVSKTDMQMISVHYTKAGCQK
jgi:hypothetical protein